MKKLLTLAAAALVFAACNQKTEETAEMEVIESRLPEWAKNANIYEVNIRQYTPEGTFAAFEAHLPRLQKMGVDILWFMPIQPVGVLNRKGELGSYYSIADYTATNPEFGTMEDFKRLVNKAHELGMKVILDWVANHTAFDHVWVAQHPEFYTADSLGNRPVVAIDADGKPTDWTDVADLDYANPDMRKAMIEDMRFWLVNAQIDGFRCDVAGFVPVDFWNDATPSLQQTKPDLFMLAEWENPDYMKAFNMGYGWSMHHEMNQVAQGKKGPETFNEYLEKLNKEYGSDDCHMLFIDNHDENSWNGTVEERMGPAAKAMFVLATTFQNGMPLMYSGQEAGLNKRLRFFAKDTIDWTVADHSAFYTEMLKLKHDNHALWNGNYGGKMTLIPTEQPDKVYAFYREKNGNRVVVFLNFSADEVPLKADLSSIEGSYIEYPTGTNIALGNTSSLVLEPWGYLILTQNVPPKE
jgi:glycosidase